MAPEIASLLGELQQLTTNQIPGIESSRESLLHAARQLVRRLETPAERITRMSWYDSTLYGVVKVLTDLGIFKLLEARETSTNVPELAKASHADEKLLSRLIEPDAVQPPETPA